jgi:hypothetical protein
MNEPETTTNTHPPNENTTLRRFVVALIRIQALWMFFYAFYYGLSYLPTYFRNFHSAIPDSAYYTEAKFSLLMEFFRILIHIVAGILILQYTRPLLDYLLKDADEEAEPVK